MFTLKIENAKGEIFELTHDSTEYSIIGVQGLTPPPTAVNTSTGGTLDGTFYNSSRVNQRNIVITIVLNGDIEGNRQRLYQIFNIKKQCSIYFSNKNRNVQIVGYVETLEGDLFVQREQIQISIICPRPYFEDLKTIYTELAQIVRMFEFPFTIEETDPIPFSEIQEFPLCTINNGGDVETGFVMKIMITGATRNIKIYNTTRGEFFGISNYNADWFESGDEITINSLSGTKTVTLTRSGVTTSILNQISEGSTWLKLDVGENDFTYTAQAGADVIRIVFISTNLYGGV